jgi:hypothetical protein
MNDAKGDVGLGYELLEFGPKINLVIGIIGHSQPLTGRADFLRAAVRESHGLARGTLFRRW